MNLPEEINTTKELEEILSRPSESLVQYIKGLDGDVMILGAGGKVGPTMARTARRAIDAAGINKKVIAVDVVKLPDLEKEGLETIACDMLDWKAVNSLPRVKNIVYMVGRKFGSQGSEWLTWAINVMAPHNVADIFTESRIAVFSTGCVYPVVDISTGGSVETDAPDPIGEYSMSCLGRERMFDYYSAQKSEKVVQIRLNYALELRYGVFVDIATRVFNDQPIDVTTGFINGIWQGDCCNQVLQSFDLAGSPSCVLNITGPETISVRWLAHKFGELFDKEVKITGQENGKGYLSNASKANAFFGNPIVPADKIIAWIAHWIKKGGENLGKETHFETQDGKY